MVSTVEVAREAAVSALTEWLIDVFGFGRVRSHSPVEGIGQSSGVVVLAGLSREFWGRYPSGSETLLVVDVAAASVERYLNIQADLYARAGVPEYWVLDLPGRFLHMYRKPFEGRYTEVLKVPEDGVVSSENRSDAAVTVKEFLPVRL